jgi:hypothetical protein
MNYASFIYNNMENYTSLANNIVDVLKKSGIFKYYYLRSYPNKIVIGASTALTSSNFPKTIPGGTDYTGVFMSIYPNKYLEIDEINVDEKERGKGVGEKIINIIYDEIENILKIKHSFDISDGFWERMKAKYPDYFI